jgi:hypothetical protein
MTDEQAKEIIERLNKLKLVDGVDYDMYLVSEKHIARKEAYEKAIEIIKEVMRE